MTCRPVHRGLGIFLVTTVSDPDVLCMSQPEPVAMARLEARSCSLQAEDGSKGAST
jgi:hypothetical protein